MWPWEFLEHNIDPCPGPLLFGALIKKFRFAYYGSGIKLDPTHLSYLVNLCQTFLNLPLDIQERIAN